jgi:hypothetical protein
MIMANGNYTVNAIVSDIRYLDGGSTGRRETTYRNVSGNYDGNIRMMFNTPLKNKKFSVNSMSMARYANSHSFIDNEKNTNRNLTLSERAGIDFRSSVVDLGINGNIRYNRANYSLQPASNVNTCNYGAGGSAVLYLPCEFKLESDISWSTSAGYQAGYEQDETIWNASVSKSFLKGNQATLRLKMYDILQQRSGILQQINSEGYTYSNYNTLSRYVMVHLVYRFSAFKGGATQSDVFSGRGPGGEGRRPGGPPMRF